MKMDRALFQIFSRIRGQSKVRDHLAIFAARHLVILMAIASAFIFSLLPPDADRPRLFEGALLSVVIAWPLAVLLEFFFGRRRPYEAMHKKPLEEFWTPTPSFPSSHAAIAFAIATPVFFFHPILGLIFYLFAAFVALARVYVGVHYASDVIAGAILGTAISLIIQRL
jgi:undecaprenyl-diphosphatase